MSKKFIAVAVSAAATVVLLAGCSTGGSGSSSGSDGASTPKTQTKAAACKSISDDMSEISSGLQSQVTKLQSDPTAAAAEIAKFDTKLKAAVDKVQNADVKESATKFESAFGDLSDQLTAYSKDPSSVDATKLQSSITAVQTQTTNMSKVCSGS